MVLVEKNIKNLINYIYYININGFVWYIVRYVIFLVVIL